MNRWVVLGSAYSVPGPYATNTHFLLETPKRVLLVDCPADVLPRLWRLGLSHESVTDLVLTHFHPDHVSGLALFLQNLWLLGRTAPLTLYGPEDTLQRAEALLSLFRWERWDRQFEVHFRRYTGPGIKRILEAEDLRMYAAEVCHSIPAIGLRLEFPDGHVLTYSCDTAPCKAVVELARGATWLFHEATGTGPYHTTAHQAGEVAREAGAEHLFLVHTDPDPYTRRRLEAAARETFPGPVTAAWDGLTLVW